MCFSLKTFLSSHTPVASCCSLLYSRKGRFMLNHEYHHQGSSKSVQVLLSIYCLLTRCSRAPRGRRGGCGSCCGRSPGLGRAWCSSPPPTPSHGHLDTGYRYVRLVDCRALQLGTVHPGEVPECHYCIVLFLESSIIQFCSHLLLADNAITGDPYT